MILEARGACRVLVIRGSLSPCICQHMPASGALVWTNPQKGPAWDSKGRPVSLLGPTRLRSQPWALWYLHARLGSSHGYVQAEGSFYWPTIGPARRFGACSDIAACPCFANLVAGWGPQCRRRTLVRQPGNQTPFSPHYKPLLVYVRHMVHRQGASIISITIPLQSCKIHDLCGLRVYRSFLL